MPYTAQELETLRYAEDLAKELIREHLGLLFQFKWNNRKRSLGVCNYDKRTIELSRVLTCTQSRDQIRNTILHEICHALTPGAGHGPEWKRMARRLGCNPRSVGTLSQAGRERMTQVAPWALMFNDEVVRVYHKRPTRSMDKLKSMYIRGRRAETLGQMRIVPNPQFEKY